MFFRKAFPTFWVVVAVLAAGFAGLQTFRLAERNAVIGVLAQKLAAISRETKPADAGKVRELTAELAAARQQLSSTETAMTEAEARLSEEINAHAASKAKAAAAAAALAEAERKALTASADAEAARLALQRSSKAVTIETTGSISPPAPPASASPSTASSVTSATPEAASPAAAANASVQPSRDTATPSQTRRQVRREPARTANKRAPRTSAQSPSMWMTPYLR